MVMYNSDSNDLFCFTLVYKIVYQCNSYIYTSKYKSSRGYYYYIPINTNMLTSYSGEQHASITLHKSTISNISMCVSIPASFNR